MRVSVIVNNYNYAAFVGQAITSALEQNYANLEVIVVDDGSTDDSMLCIKEYAERARVVVKPNGGQGSAYNAGFAIATGEIVIFLDADDWLLPRALENIVRAWHPGVCKVQFRMEMTDSQGQFLGRVLPRQMHDKEALVLLKQFGTYGSPPGSGNAYAAGFLRKIMPLEESLWRTGADSVPALMAPAYGEVVSLSQPQAAYRLHKHLDNDATLIANNAPKSLWHEYERLQVTKEFIGKSLTAMNIAAAEPLLLAPWESRLTALCLRFGGEYLSARQQTTASVLRRIAASIFAWPKKSLKDAVLNVGWIFLVLLLPRALAWRVALMHKAAMGAAVDG